MTSNPASWFPLLRRVAHRASVAVLLISLGPGLDGPAAATEDDGPPGLIVFDIPRRPLAEALESYGRTTGRAALVDQGLVAGRRSTPVRGRLSADEALQILLAGTGLSVRYASRLAFTLAAGDPEPGSSPAASPPRGAEGMASLEERRWFADLQAALIQALCRYEQTEPGEYRLAIQLWIGPGGVPRASHLLASSGDRDRDATVEGALDGIAVAPPPPGLPQPVTIMLLPRRGQPECRRGGGLRE